MIKKLVYFVSFFLLFNLTSGAQESENSEIHKWLDVTKIFGIEPVGIQWHSSGDFCAFLWNESGDDSREIYIYYPSGNKREKLTDTVEIEIQNRLPDESSAEKLKSRSKMRTQGISEFVFHPKTKQIYFVYDRDIYKISINDKKPERVTRTVEEESCIKISPDGKWLSFVRGNNIWLLGLEGGSEIQLTDTGSDTMINGRAVYPKPILPEEKSAYEWNGISSGLAFITTDISPLTNRSGINSFYKSLNESLVPNILSPIPRYKVSTVFLRDYKISQLKTGDYGESYIRKILWRPVSLDLLILQEDRKFKKVGYYIVNTYSAESKLIFEEKDEKAVNPENRFVAFSQDGAVLYLTSEEDGWNHLYSLGVKTEEKRQLTKGNWEITGLEGVDEKNNIYITTTRIRPNQRHLEKVSPDTGLIEQVTFVEGCHSCVPSPSFSDALDFFKGNFVSGDLYYFAFNRPYQRSRITSPPVPNYNDLPISEPRYITFKNHKDGGLIFARMWSPKHPGADASPAIIMLKDEYSQPAVLRSFFKKDIRPNLLTAKGYYVLELDQRGTSGYGKKWRTDNYMRAGENDAEDILSGAEYLASQQEIDPNRIGLIGTGYGAYLALWLTGKDHGPFKTIVAANPMVLWNMYDTRFMQSVFGDPTDENRSYKNFELNSFTNDFNHDLLIILNSDINSESAVYTNQYFKQMLSDGARFELRYTDNDTTSPTWLEDKYKFIEEIQNYLGENL